MNEPDTADGEGEDKGPLAGERLAAARRQLKIPLGDVAKALHLDEHKVAALEANRFEIVGPPVFAKGHLRKYAELVGVPIEDMLADSSTARPPVRVCFTVDEEIGRGVDKLDLDRLGADVAYTVDGSATGTLSFETFNAAEAVIRVKGVNVHPGYATDVMANAVTILAGILTRLPGSEAPETTHDREGYWCPIESSGTISEAKAKMILRDFSWDGLTRRKQLVERLVETARLEHPRAEIELEVTDQYKNMKAYIEEKDPRAVSFAFAAAEEMGIPMETHLVRGGTDGSRMSEMGLPTPNVFNGGYDYHSRFEWNTVQNLELSLDYLKRLVRYWAEHGRDDGPEVLRS